MTCDNFYFSKVRSDMLGVPYGGESAFEFRPRSRRPRIGRVLPEYAPTCATPWRRTPTRPTPLTGGILRHGVPRILCRACRRRRKRSSSIWASWAGQGRRSAPSRDALPQSLRSTDSLDMKAPARRVLSGSCSPGCADPRRGPYMEMKRSASDYTGGRSRTWRLAAGSAGPSAAADRLCRRVPALSNT